LSAVALSATIAANRGFLEDRRQLLLRFALFCAASIAILPLSWRSLRDPRTHGFYRFFAFELLLALILLNAPIWFRDPFSPCQLLAWLCGVVSIELVIEGFRLLHVIGRPAPTAQPSANLAIENTTALVTVGAYRWIRHPLYASLLALGWCAWLKQPLGLASILLAVGATVSLLATAMTEEKENMKRFCAAYADYMKKSKRFIPFIF
jgi:protein-S-isoprenylcysteine O-methyltransferase Ste14